MSFELIICRFIVFVHGISLEFEKFDFGFKNKEKRQMALDNTERSMESKTSLQLFTIRFTFSLLFFETRISNYAFYLNFRIVIRLYLQMIT